MFALVALLIGLSKGGLGGPVPVSLTAPLLSLVIPVSQAVGTVVPLLIFADLFALYFYWQRWDLHYIRLMLPAAVVGVVLGTTLLATLPNEILRDVIGMITILAVAYRLASSRLRSIRYEPRAWHGVFAGWASGFGSSLANVGAPPFTAYMLLQPNMQPIPFIGTATLFFAVLNALKVPGFLATGTLDIQLLLEIAFVIPIIPFGVWLGRYIVIRMRPVLFERIMVTALFIMGIWLVIT